MKKHINNYYCYFRTESNTSVCNNNVNVENEEEKEEESAQDDTPSMLHFIPIILICIHILICIPIIFREQQEAKDK